MQTGFRLARGSDLSVQTTLRGVGDSTLDGGNPSLSNIDYSDEEAVAIARSDLVQRQMWHGIKHWAFLEGHEDEAIAAIAEIVLCRNAAMWRRSMDGRAAAPGLGWNDAASAQVRLFSVLSPEGAQAMMARHQIAAEGVRYMPDTGIAEADKLLDMVVPEDVLQALRNAPGGASAVAELLHEHAQAWRQAEPLRAAAMRQEEESWAESARQNFCGAALAMERAAATWKCADQSGLTTALRLGIASMQWRAHGSYDKAAQLDIAAARIWSAAGMPADEARAYNNAATSWFFNGKYALAGETHLLEASAWEAANQSRAAALAWQAGGAPDRSARSWKRAIHEAGAETSEARAIQRMAWPLFHVCLDSEASTT